MWCCHLCGCVVGVCSCQQNAAADGEPGSNNNKGDDKALTAAREECLRLEQKLGQVEATLSELRRQNKSDSFNLRRCEDENAEYRKKLKRVEDTVEGFRKQV